MSAQLLLELLPPPAPTFDNFVCGGNAEVVRALQAVAAGAGAERIVFVWGAPGSGRSHLLQACAAAARERGAAAACRRGGESEPWPAAADLLALDDAHRCDAGQQAALFSRLVGARDGDGVLVASGPAAPAALPLREDVRTRLASGWVFRVRPLSDEEKLAALTARAAQRGFDLPPEAARYLLNRCPRDLPTLLAWLDRLDRHSLERQRPVTVRLLQELLGAADGR